MPGFCSSSDHCFLLSSVYIRWWTYLASVETLSSAKLQKSSLSNERNEKSCRRQSQRFVALFLSCLVFLVLFYLEAFDTLNF